MPMLERSIYFCGVIFYRQILALPASSNARQDDEADAMG